MKTYKKKLNKLSLVREDMELFRAKIGSSKNAADYLKTQYKDSLTIYESFTALFLNNHNNTIGFVEISKGGITGTFVDIRIVAKYALDVLATGVIFAHNHPSGNTKPSEADKSLTQKLLKGLALIDVKVLDHIILTEDSYLSFADENLI